MTRSVSTFWSLLLCVVLAAPTVRATDPQVHGSHDVLTLEEAAELLRVSPDELLHGARNGEVPGRRIGAQWRFSRSGLMAWLAGSPGSAPDSVALGEPDLGAIRGHGVWPGSFAPAPPVIGEEPEGDTADEVFLRGQRILLAPGQLVLEPALFLLKMVQQHQVKTD